MQRRLFGGLKKRFLSKAQTAIDQGNFQRIKEQRIGDLAAPEKGRKCQNEDQD